MEVARFFFGNGWISLWYALFYLLVIPLPLYYRKEIREYIREGPGPGGLGLCGVLSLEGALLGAVGLVNTLLWVWGAPMPLSYKALWVAAGAVGLPGVVFVAGLPMGNASLWGYYLFHTMYAAAVLVNLGWLYLATTPRP